MKYGLFFLVMLFTLSAAQAQSSLFGDESNVITYMDGKTFNNSDNGLDIEYGYISVSGHCKRRPSEK
jgi:hypothetical protein